VSEGALRPAIEPKYLAYLRIARPAHWVKHVFIVPGLVAALVLVGHFDRDVLGRMVLGFASACLLASANYVINEFLDAEFDRHHPLKRHRPGAQNMLSPRLVFLEYVLLAVAGLWLAFLIGKLFLLASLFFVLSGITYNVTPFRTKDRAYLDVISEAINNPIRLTLGWAMVSTTTVPPLSLVGTYWLGGAFLMAAKRLAEYRFIVKESGPEAPGRYRRSFAFYTANSLLVSCFVYAIMASFTLAVFLVKYRTEYVLSFPLFTGLFAYYLHMTLQTASAAQRPERLHRDRVLVGIVLALTIVMTVLTFVDMPVLDALTQSRFTQINLGN
jgi:4-hydroxybenzoate polyprenyltransferase